MPNIIENARDLRKNSTEAEKLLWSRIRDRQLNGLKFKRQHPFAPYILDFFCEEHALAVELDGGQHNEPEAQKKDSKRTDFIQAKGIRVLRFWNNDVLQNIQGVLETISMETPSPQPSPGGRGSSSAMSEKRILIAEITTAHGIKGFVKVKSYAQDEAVLKQDLFDEKGKVFHLTLKNAIKGAWVAEVKGITDRNTAELLRGTKLYIEREAMPEADDGEYYIEDLKGLRVIDEKGADIGIVLSVENFGAGDLLDIKPTTGASFYLLFTDETIKRVNLSERFLEVVLPSIL